MNLPNRLTIARMLTIPVFLVFVIFDFFPQNDWLWRILSTALFIAISVTDLLDGRIARSCGIVTDFGKFLDPLADKLLIFSAYLALSYRFAAAQGLNVYTAVVVCSSFLVIFRELAVTSMRMIVSGKVDVAAKYIGKVKTTAQVVCVCALLMEPVLFDWEKWAWGRWFAGTHIFAYAILAAMLFFTIYSGICYAVAYLPKIRPDR